jgi:hypothetical protein
VRIGRTVVWVRPILVNVNSKVSPGAINLPRCSLESNLPFITSTCLRRWECGRWCRCLSIRPCSTRLLCHEFCLEQKSWNLILTRRLRRYQSGVALQGQHFWRKHRFSICLRYVHKPVIGKLTVAAIRSATTLIPAMWLSRSAVCTTKGG